MSILNNRIQKLKVVYVGKIICLHCFEENNFFLIASVHNVLDEQERESNPILRLQDTVADSVEPLKRETARAAQKIPDPRDMIPSTLPNVSTAGRVSELHASPFDPAKVPKRVGNGRATPPPPPAAAAADPTAPPPPPQWAAPLAVVVGLSLLATLVQVTTI